MASRIHRFAILGDTHATRDNTSSTDTVGVDNRSGPPTEPSKAAERMDFFRDSILREHAHRGLDFVIHIGDIVHSGDSVSEHAAFRSSVFDTLPMPWYVTYGNHDRISEEEWQRVYGQPRDYAFVVGSYGFVILNSSDTDGSYTVCVSQDFLAKSLSELSDCKGVFFVSHVPRFAGFRPDAVLETSGADSPDCRDIMEMLANAGNLICCIHGHWHWINNIMMFRAIPMVFVSHFAHFGTDYYGLRIIEIYDDGSVYTYLQGFTGERRDGTWHYHIRTQQYFNLTTHYLGR